MSALDATLRQLANVVDASDRGHPEAESHLRAHGWEYVGGRYRSPDELAALPVCRHCGERFSPKAWSENYCLGLDDGNGTHEPVESV